LLGALACFLGAIRLTFDRDDLGAVNQAVDEGDNTAALGKTSRHSAKARLVVISVLLF
jgi:hypothetical protein